MRRPLIAVAVLALTAAGSLGPGATPAYADVDCTDYCGKLAAARCVEIDSWECGWYIAGCLAGCNLREL